MKVAANIFWIIGLFFIAAATLYGFWVEWTEWAGIPPSTPWAGCPG